MSNCTYFVSHNMRYGFWIVCSNTNGHYRDVGKYSNRQAAVNAANALNKQNEEVADQTFRMVGAL